MRFAAPAMPACWRHAHVTHALVAPVAKPPETSGQPPGDALSSRSIRRRPAVKTISAASASHDAGSPSY